jgi:tripartite-type tricarboxylate transporter receptor subunit TctC
MPRIFVALALALTLTTPAPAQEWPSRPMTMVVAYAAGGPVDTIARIFGQRLSEVLGQQVVIENIGGAGGMVGASRVAKAAPDGYNFLFGGLSNLAQNQTLYKQPLYNAATDFTPVALIAETPIALITRNDLPVKSFKEFVAYAKENQAKMQYGSAGAGSATHLACVVLNSAIGVNITHVPYRGTGPAMQDLQGGRIDYLCDIIATAKAQIDGGTVKGIAIMTSARAPSLPNLPTAKEQGTDVEAYTWSAIFLPKGAPAAVVKKLNDAALATMNTPAVKDTLDKIGATLVAPDRRSPDYLGKFVHSEIEKWAVPIKASNVSID